MWRWFAVFFVGGVLGTAFGVGVGFFIFPYVFPPPPAMEALAVDDEAEAVARGMFIHANPSDPIHYGEGSVTVYEDVVFLEDDFKVGPGPAFHVYLVPQKEICESSEVKNTMYVDLGKLRAFEGSQNYRRGRPQGLSQRRHLVRPVRRPDLARRPRLRDLTATAPSRSKRGASPVARAPLSRRSR